MIIFENPGEIDVRSICTFGVSVKAGDNPIGFFGTGLKYAIAVLLRTGHEVTIQSGLTVVRFGLSKESIRGQDFEFVTMATGDSAPQSIGFTTQLGKQWELWMAYREIACNCKDENGRGFHAIDVPRTHLWHRTADFDAAWGQGASRTQAGSAKTRERIPTFSFRSHTL